jgi:elongation factor Ts
MAITAKAVSELREKTGVGMMECKKALTESNGDFDEAIKILRERGLAVAAKKASRIAAEGIVDILYCEDCKTAAMIEVNIETDFAAKNEIFQEFVKGCLKAILKEKPADVEELLAKPFNGELTVDAMLKEKVLQIGENISVRRFVTVSGALNTYIHNKGTIGVIVAVNADDIAAADGGLKEVTKNVALQIASMNPVYVNKDEVPASAIEEEREIVTNQIKNDPANEKKPANVLEKMIEGKVGKYYETYCLLEQDYVKDEKMTVGEYIQAYAKQIGASVGVDKFYRFEKGEGLQKREENYAEEIAKLAGGAK